MAKENQDRQSADRKDRTVIRLSFTSLLTFIFLGFAAIALAYIGGVMSGRQSCPVPERLPGAEQAMAGKPGDESSYILAPSELAFARELRGENNRVPKISQVMEGQKAQSEAEKKAAEANSLKAPAADVPKTQAPETSSGKAQAEASKAQAPVAAGGQGQAAAALEKPATDDAMYDHEFQVGAFRDENAVDKLRQQLEGHGLRTAMRKEGKVYVVLVRLRGTSARASEIVALAHSLGLGEPVRRSRQPVRE